MDSQKLDLPSDLTGDAYTAVLGDAMARNYCFSLTLRDSSTYDPKSHLILERVKSCLLSIERVDRWPGTRLFSGGATLLTGVINSTSLPTLADVGSLFAWQSPFLPDDLAIYDKDSAVLFSVAHEQLGWVNLSAFSESLWPILRTIGKPSIWFRGQD